MTWIKQNYDRFLLALVALALAVCAGLLINNARGFNAVFASLSGDVHKAPNLPRNSTDIANRAAVARDLEKLDKPDQWQARMMPNSQRLPVFVSVPYIQKGEALIDPYDAKIMLHSPVPNQWLIDNKQNLLDANVLEQDTDGDGFSTLDEWNGKTNPDDKNSHPPYYTKLYLKNFVRIPFLLTFSARNGKKFQVNTVTENDDEPTQFVELNSTVRFRQYRFKVTKFEEKNIKEEGIMKDKSELTLQNLDNGQVVVLPKGDTVDSPTTYAVFSYLWTGKEFAVLKGAEFTIKPEDNVKYKVLEMSDNEIKVLKEDENKPLSITKRPMGK